MINNRSYSCSSHEPLAISGGRSNLFDGDLIYLEMVDVEIDESLQLQSVLDLELALIPNNRELGGGSGETKKEKRNRDMESHHM